MNSQPTVYSKYNPSFTNSVVNYGFTRMEKTFGERLQEKLDEAGIKAAELSRLSGVTKQNIGRILNNTPHSITGALPKPEPETVEKLAKALNWDLNDALPAAGYAAPFNQSEVNIIANRLAKGVMASGFHDLEDEELREAFLADMQTIAESMLKRRLEEQNKKKRKIQK